jgi:hypothetical protein
MASIGSTVVAGFVAFRPQGARVHVKFNVAKLPIPKISSEARNRLATLAADTRLPDWADVLFGLSFLPSVEMVSIEIQNASDRPSGNIEVLASGARLWHHIEYIRATPDGTLAVGHIEPKRVMTITAFIGVGRPYLTICVRQDGHLVGRLRGS